MRRSQEIILLFTLIFAAAFIAGFLIIDSKNAEIDSINKKIDSMQATQAQLNMQTPTIIQPAQQAAAQPDVEQEILLSKLARQQKRLNEQEKQLGKIKKGLDAVEGNTADFSSTIESAGKV